MNAMMGIYGDLFGEFNRMQQNLDQLFRPGGVSGIRAMPRRTFPVINVGSTPEAIDVLALAPGIDPNALQITIDKGVLVISGERTLELPEESDTVSLYAQERFQGSFRRVISLPEDVDPAQVDASYRDGLLRVRVGRREEARPRRVQVS